MNNISFSIYEASSQINSIITDLVSLNACLRFPEELRLDDIDDFKVMEKFGRKHNLQLLKNVGELGLSTCYEIICMIDDIERFKIRYESSMIVSLIGSIYLESLDGFLPIHDKGELASAIAYARCQDLYNKYKKETKSANDKSMEEDLNKLLEDNITKLSGMFPWNTQKMQLIEEVGELLQALSKYERSNGDGQPTSVTPHEARKNLIEEFAGVQVMLSEIMKMFDIEKEVRSEMIYQTNRTLDRCKGDTKE